MYPAPIESENLDLRDEGWRLVLKSLDSRCSGLGLLVGLVLTGDAGSQYLSWPGDRIRCTSVLGLVVKVTLSKRRFQIQIGLALDRLAMDYVAW